MSTYIIDRDPGRFGGQQQDYLKEVEKVVSETTASSLPAFFRSYNSLVQLERLPTG